MLKKLHHPPRFFEKGMQTQALIHACVARNYPAYVTDKQISNNSMGRSQREKGKASYDHEEKDPLDILNVGPFIFSQ